MDQIRQGTELEAMLNNEFFKEMIAGMEQSVLAQIKQISRDVTISSEKKGDMLLQAADKLCAIQDTVESMEGLAQAAQNLQYEQETAQ